LQRPEKHTKPFTKRKVELFFGNETRLVQLTIFITQNQLVILLWLFIGSPVRICHGFVLELNGNTIQTSNNQLARKSVFAHLMALGDRWRVSANLHSRGMCKEAL
jgi:hypothetical protein